MICFTLDYLIRFFCVKQKWVWFLNGFNIIDLIAFFPFWIEFILIWYFPTLSPAVPAGLAVLRLSRVFRVFKVGKYSSVTKLAYRTVIESQEGFVLLIWLVAILVIVAASSVFYAEQTGMYFNQTEKLWYYNDASSPSPYQSIFASSWWGVVTLTTVGYGDIVPATILGKVFATFTMIMGLLVLAFPVSIFSSKFSQIYNLKEQERTNKKLAKMRASQKKISLRQVAKLIRQLEREEFELKEMIENFKNATEESEHAIAKIHSLVSQFQKLDISTVAHIRV